MTNVIDHNRYSSGSERMPAESLERGPLLGALILVLRERRLIFVVTVLVTVAVIAAVLLKPRTYASTSSFTPQGRKGMSAASGLAAQFGVSLDAGDGAESPAFYADLVTSREILNVILDSVRVPQAESGAAPVALIDFLVPKKMDTLRKRAAAIDSLKLAIASAVSKKTGVVTVAVHARMPALAYAIDQRLLDEVNRFNLVGRQSQASAERQFAETRASEARQHLRDAEDALQSFLQQNRGGNSPALEFQRDRLAREVSLRQQLYVTLSQAFEQARIDEVRDTPVVTIVERPTYPAEPQPRGLVRQAIIAMIAAFMLGAIIALLKSQFAALEQNDRGGREELGDLWRSTKEDISRLWGGRGRRGSKAAA